MRPPQPGAAASARRAAAPTKSNTQHGVSLLDARVAASSSSAHGPRPTALLPARPRASHPCERARLVCRVPAVNDAGFGGPSPSGQGEGGASTPASSASASADAAWASWADAPDVPSLSDAAGGGDDDARRLADFAAALAGNSQASAPPSAAAEALDAVQVTERAFLVGVSAKGGRASAAGGRAAAARAAALATAAGADPAAAAAAGPPALELSPEESLDELAALADTAGLEVVGRLTQALDGGPNPRTYLNAGKLAELGAALASSGADTVIFDDELSPGQSRTLERALGSAVRLCDRTALILDIFAQRAASAEGQLQVALAAAEYQLPRLTRLWTHLERQAGGRTKGMGEKQLEVDKRLLRSRMAGLRADLEDVRRARAGRAARRAAAGLPTVALVGYTSAGKSSLLNALTGAGVLADDRLFATLDPATRRLSLPAGKEVLLCDTVGFIQKLPTSLVAAFRATLEAASDADLLLHVVDVSHPAAAAQSAAVAAVLAEIGAAPGGVSGDENTTTSTPPPPLITVWNKVDAAPDPDAVRAVAAARRDTVPVSALTGEGLAELVAAVERAVGAALAPVCARLPFAAGDLAAEARRSGVVAGEGFTPDGIVVLARVPPALASRLAPYTLPVAEGVAALEAAGVEVGSDGSDAWWEEGEEEAEDDEDDGDADGYVDGADDGAAARPRARRPVWAVGGEAAVGAAAAAAAAADGAASK